MSGANFQVDCTYIERKFYVACNSVLAGCKYADEFVKLSLVKSKCLPLLTYCLGALVLTQSKVRDLGVCWNDCFVKYSNIVDGNLYLNCSSVVVNRHSSVYMIKVA